MATEESGQSIPWNDEFSTQATTLPEIIQEESNQITTVVIFVISALLTITLLFGIAIFIDCRQEKLHKLQFRKKPKKKLKVGISVPRIGRPVRYREEDEDTDTLADRMQECESAPCSSNSNSNVIV